MSRQVFRTLLTCVLSSPCQWVWHSDQPGTDWRAQHVTLRWWMVAGVVESEVVESEVVESEVVESEVVL